MVILLLRKFIPVCIKCFYLLKHVRVLLIIGGFKCNHSAPYRLSCRYGANGFRPLGESGVREGWSPKRQRARQSIR